MGKKSGILHQGDLFLAMKQAKLLRQYFNQRVVLADAYSEKD